MRLKSITLQNFKQYYGEQPPIVFEDDSDMSTKNVTVIYGENGRGKTTLYRALMFGLYGDTTLDQDESDNADSVIYLGNLKALEELQDSDGRLEVSVTIRFSHEKELYEIKRYFFATMDETGRIFEDRPSVKLSIIMTDGNTKNLDDSQSDEIEELVRSVLDERVKNYFLFDGERIERLTKASKRQREEVQKGIKNLLKIDNLYMVKAALEDNRRTILNELKLISSGDMLKNIRELDAVDNKSEELKKQKQQLESELLLAEKEKESIDSQLNEQDRPLIKQIMDIENEINSHSDEYLAMKQELVDLTPSFGIVLMKDEIGAMIAELEDKRERGEIPSEIKTELIDRILNELTCICGREIELGSDAYRNLLSWKKLSNPQVIEKNAMSFFGSLKQVAAEVDYRTRDIRNALVKLTQHEESIEELNSRLDQSREKLGEPTSEVSMHDFDYRDSLMIKIGEKEQKLRQLEEDMIRVEAERTSLLSKQKSLQAENEAQKMKNRQLEIVNESLAALATIIDKFEVEIKAELHDRANEIFGDLIDEAGKSNLSEIVIKDNYTLDVLDWNRRPFLANISAGQRQIISLSFITALAQVAGGSNTLEVPLFMDTPFGRLSPSHRGNLVNLIPHITPQWILLVTGTEFRAQEEAKTLESTGRWGRLYVLESETPGVTRIRESSPQALLQGERSR